MKKKFIYITFLIISIHASGEGSYYYGKGEKISLYTYKDMISVRWYEDVSVGERVRILATIPEIQSYYDIDRYQLSIVRMDTTKTQMVLRQLLASPRVEFGHPLLHIGENDTFLVSQGKVQKSKDQRDWQYLFEVRYFKGSEYHTKKSEYHTKKNEGWLNGSDVNLSYVLLLLDAGLHLQSLAHDFRWGSYRDFSSAESMYVRLLDDYPDYRLFNRRMDYLGSFINSGSAALYYLSQLCREKKDYYKAIDFLNRITEKYPNEPMFGSKAEPIAQLEIAKIYWKNLRQRKHALKSYHEIIRLYPGEAIEHYEGRSTVDIEALDAIAEVIDTFKLDEKEAIKQYSTVISESKFDVVKAYAYLRLASIYGRFGRFDEVVKVTCDLINKFPATRWCSFKDEIHYYAIDALELLCDTYVEDLNNPDEAITICDEIYNANKDQDLAKAAMFFKNMVKDRSIWPRDEVIEGYEVFLKFFGNCKICGRAKERLRIINLLEPQHGYITYDFAELRAAPVLKGKISKTLNKGDKIFAYYWVSSVDESYYWRWFKVMTEDSLVGWVKETHIHLEKFHGK